MLAQPKNKSLKAAQVLTKNQGGYEKRLRLKGSTPHKLFGKTFERADGPSASVHMRKRGQNAEVGEKGGREKRGD